MPGRTVYCTITLAMAMSQHNLYETGKTQSNTDAAWDNKRFKMEREAITQSPKASHHPRVLDYFTVDVLFKFTISEMYSFIITERFIWRNTETLNVSPVSDDKMLRDGENNWKRELACPYSQKCSYYKKIRFFPILSLFFRKLSTFKTSLLFLNLCNT